MPWIKDLIEVMKRQRKHASFFEWPEKEIKEIGIVKLLFESMQKKGICPYHNPVSFKNDPPDCIAQDINGNAVAIEVSELVDFETICDAEHNKAKPKYWKNNEVIEHIEQIIYKKEQKKFNGGPYKHYVLLIFTDEPFIETSDLLNTLIKYQFKKPRLFDEIYLLFSYDSWSKSYPYVNLNISDNISLVPT